MFPDRLSFVWGACRWAGTPIKSLVKGGAVTQSHIDRLIKLYRTALKILVISTGLKLISIIAELLTTTYIPFLMGGGVFSPSVTLIGDALAWPGILWLYKRAQSLKSLDDEKAATVYRSMWGFQLIIGTFVTLGAIAMIPGSVFALQMGVAGLAILLPIFGGAWIFSQARKINQEIVAGRQQVETNAEPTPNPYLKTQADSASKDANSRNAGILLLVGAALMLVINVFTEFALVNDLRNTPEFFGPDSRMGYVSWSIGYAGVADVLFFGTLGIAVLAMALVARKRMAKSRFIAIVVVSVLQLALFSGSLAPTIAKALGPSQIANNLQGQADDASVTIKYLQSIDPPAGFEGSLAEPFAEETNLQWGLSANTGAEAPIREKCTAVVEYAFGLGATDWMRKDTRETGKVADQAATIQACEQVLDGYPRLKVKRFSTYSDSFVMGGIANFEPSSPLTFDLMLMNTDPKSEKPNTFSFELYISTAYGMDPVLRDGDLSLGTVEVNELLNIIGQARLANPDRNPTDPAFMREILATYKYDLKLKLFESKPGVADRIELTDSDNFHMCLSVEPWDEKKMAQEDPGWGYGLAGMYEKLSELNGFGNYKEGSCKG